LSKLLKHPDLYPVSISELIALEVHAHKDLPSSESPERRIVVGIRPRRRDSCRSDAFGTAFVTVRRGHPS
jgi:hypothetical protein